MPEMPGRAARRLGTEWSFGCEERISAARR
jgi:hypothetical protein